MKIEDVSKKLNIYTAIQILEEGLEDYGHGQATLDRISIKLQGHPAAESLERDLSDLIYYVGQHFFVKGLHAQFNLQNRLLQHPYPEYEENY